MTDFKISKKLSLMVDCATWVIAFLAKRGAGKTYNASVLAEEMLRAGIPIVVIDGMGTWWGLRVGKDGEGPGLPIIVFGGRHADFALFADKAKQIARAIVETNISAVLDLKDFSKGLAKRVVADFVDELYRINVQERHIFIEESDLWAPQKPYGPEALLCLGAMEDLVRRGGNNNLGCSLITQRSAVLNKDLLTQADCLVILRTLAPQDKKAIQLWVEEQTDEDRTKLKQWFDSLKSLKNGEAWIWHPEKPVIFEKIQFRERETFHATRKFLLSPKAKSIQMMPVEEFKNRFKDAFEPKPVKPPVVQPSHVEKRAVIVRREVPGGDTVTQHLGFSKIERTPSQTVQSEPKATAQKIVPPEETTGPVETVQATIPGKVILEKIRPIPQISVSLTDTVETPSALARALIVLTNDNGKNDNKWTKARIEKRNGEHAWPDEGLDDAIKMLIRWEVLEWSDTAGYYRFHRKRVEVVDLDQGVMVQ